MVAGLDHSSFRLPAHFFAVYDGRLAALDRRLRKLHAALAEDLPASEDRVGASENLPPRARDLPGGRRPAVPCHLYSGYRSRRSCGAGGRLSIFFVWLRLQSHRAGDNTFPGMCCIVTARPHCSF